MIDDILKARKWNVEKLAERIGVHKATVFRWRKDGMPESGPAKKIVEIEWKKIQHKLQSS